MILPLSEDATNFKTRHIALVFALQIELADGSRSESTCCLATADDGTL